LVAFGKKEPEKCSKSARSGAKSTGLDYFNADSFCIYRRAMFSEQAFKPTLIRKPTPRVCRVGFDGNNLKCVRCTPRIGPALRDHPDRAGDSE